MLGPVPGSRFQQGVPKVTKRLEHLLGKERQRELEEVSLERRLGGSHLCVKYLTGV